jgi:penicillin-binding protein 1B
MVMAVLLEIHYSKAEILETYINDVYLGQDGNRAIHGFGLASFFFFDKPLERISLPETALLVGLLKGPSYYSPCHHPQRAQQRRNLVLAEMAEQGFITEAQLMAARTAPLGIIDRPPRGTSPYPAFLDLVLRQLRRDYHEEDLRSEGLQVITTLDPRVQEAAEKALAGRLARLEKSRNGKTGDLQGAVVVTSNQNAEVQAVVGDRVPRFKVDWAGCPPSYRVPDQADRLPHRPPAAPALHAGHAPGRQSAGAEAGGDRGLEAAEL